MSSVFVILKKEFVVSVIRFTWNKASPELQNIISLLRLVHKICGKRLLALSCLSLHPSVLPSICPHGRIQFLLERFWWHLMFEFLSPKDVEKIKVSLISEKHNVYFVWRLFTFISICRWILVRMRNIWNKSCRENQNTYFVFSNYFLESRTVEEITWKNVVEPEGPRVIIRPCALHVG